jgi:hypothetical protein
MCISGCSMAVSMRRLCCYDTQPEWQLKETRAELKASRLHISRGAVMGLNGPAPR